MPFFAHALTGLTKSVLDGWQASTHHDVPERISGADRLRRGYHGNGRRFAGRIRWPGRTANLPMRPTDVAAVVQHGAFCHYAERDGLERRREPNAIRLPGMENVDFSVTKSVQFQGVAVVRIPDGVFQPVQPLQSGPADGGPEHSFEDIRVSGRGCAGDYDARDSVRGEAEFLGSCPARLSKTIGGLRGLEGAGKLY